jgi:hypothetical protein
MNGHATDLCLADQVCTVPFKMVAPLVPPRVKDLDDFPGSGFLPAMLGPLRWLQCSASKSQILQTGFSAMLASYNVVDVE